MINIVTIKPEDHSINQQSRILNQENYPFRICDVSLSQDRSGYVYFDMSKRNPDFGYIDATMCLRTTLLKHNQGCRDSNLPVQLRPYILIAYVCGFQIEKKKTLHESGKNREMMTFFYGLEMVETLSIIMRN